MKESFVNFIPLFDLINDAIIIVDQNGQLIFSNSKSEVIFESNDNILKFIESPKIKKIIKNADPTKRIFGENVTFKLNKIKKHFKVNVLVTGENENTLIAFVVTDATRLYELYKKQQKLINQIKKNYFDRYESLKQIADSVAHEVRNPIVSIGGYANLLKRKCEEGIDINEAKKFLNYIIQDTERLNKLTKQIEKLGDLKRIQLHSVNIPFFMKLYFNDIKSIAENMDAEIEFINNCDHHIVSFIDIEKLKSALTVLIEFSIIISSTKKITLKYYNSKYDFTILLHTKTKILKKEDIPYIFDPFYTTQHNVETLNLCLTQRIIMLHGGIIVANIKKNNLTFKINLPLDKRL